MLAIEMKGAVERVYSKIPMTTRGTVYSGSGGAWRNAPECCSDQCPGCGADLAETWRLDAESPGKLPEVGDVFRAECECGYRATGEIVELE